MFPSECPGGLWVPASFLFEGTGVHLRMYSCRASYLPLTSV